MTIKEKGRWAVHCEQEDCPWGTDFYDSHREAMDAATSHRAMSGHSVVVDDTRGWPRDEE